MICDQCNEDKPDVEKVFCPHMLDVYNTDFIVELCKACYQDRIDDI